MTKQNTKTFLSKQRHVFFAEKSLKKIKSNKSNKYKIK